MNTSGKFGFVALASFTLFAAVQIFQADRGWLSHILPLTIFQTNAEITSTTTVSPFHDLRRPEKIIMYREMNSKKVYRCSVKDPKPEKYVNPKFTLDALVDTSMSVVPPDAPFDKIVQSQDKDYLLRTNFSSVEFVSVPDHYFSERHLMTSVIYSLWSSNTDRAERRKDLEEQTHGAIRPVFVVGLPSPDKQNDFCGNYDECIDRLLSEQLVFADMLILNMTDQYDLLSLKTTALLQWVATMVPDGPEFVVKSDEDVVINYSVLVEDIIRRFPNGFTTFVYDGCLFYPWAMSIVHNRKHKYFEDIGFDKYPAYSTGGAYVLSSFAAKELNKVRTSTLTRYFKNEDAMIGFLTYFSNSPDYRGVNDRKVYLKGTGKVGFECSDTPTAKCTCDYWWAIHCGYKKVNCGKVKEAARACSHQRRSIFEHIETMTS